jgi:CubicO group peptidase (beta-lactamase class C family)
MVLRHGQVVAERWWAPYRADSPQLLYSLSKSFTSTALGFAVAEGLVDLDAPVLSYFPEFEARVTDPRSRSMRVRHVASMASGHHDDMHAEADRAGRGDLVLGLLLRPPKFEPGTFFAYNQPCTNTVAAIVRRVSGGTLVDYLRPRLFEPLDIRPYGWLTDRVGREQGYSGLHVTTESIAKLGQLYLDRGRWQGSQLLPAEWVDEATRSHVATDGENPDWSQGYGFQFWRSRHGYRGDGAFGQFMVVLPAADAVVAVTSQSPDMQGVLDRMWEHLLPALTAGDGPDGAWPSETPVLAVPAGDGSGGEIPSATFRERGGAGTGLLRAVRLTPYEIGLLDDGPEVTAQLGPAGEWVVSGPLAAAHASRDGELLVDVVFRETPHRLHLRLDIGSSTFVAEWEAEPLGTVRLSEMRMPR